MSSTGAGTVSLAARLKAVVAGIKWHRESEHKFRNTAPLLVFPFQNLVESVLRMAKADTSSSQPSMCDTKAAIAMVAAIEAVASHVFVVAIQASQQMSHINSEVRGCATPCRFSSGCHHCAITVSSCNAVGWECYHSLPHFRFSIG